MKLQSKLFLLTALILFLFSVILFNSCTKIDTSNEQPDPAKNSIKALKERYKGQENMIIYGVTGRWQIDVTFFINQFNLNRSNYTCYTPGVDEWYVISLSNKRQFLCNSGYKIYVEWKVSVPNAINLINNNGTNTTTGRVRLKNSSGITISTSNITAITFSTPVPDDPINYPDNKVYTITYETPYISQSTFNSAYTLENSMPIVATDCVDIPWFSIPVLPVYIFNVANSNTNACQRNDYVYINPPSYSGGCLGTLITSPSIAGCNIFGQCNISGYTLPQYQHVQWRRTDVTPIENWGSNPDHERLLGPSDVFTFTPGTNYNNCAQYEFRYRNETSSCPGGPGFWSPSSFWSF